MNDTTTAGAVQLAYSGPRPITYAEDSLPPAASTEGTDIGIVLDKWYLDCVSPEGAVLIGYAAKLRWGPVRLDYGARITKAKDGALSQRQRFAFGHLGESMDCITWRNDRLGVDGAWSDGVPIGETVIVDGPSGTIVWRCLGANCAVDVMVDGRQMTGTGYVEKLSMTVAPWRLPFTDLRWGRYISTDRHDHVVWIDLRGRSTRNWIWFGSGEATTGLVGDDGVHAEGAELTFESSWPLRSENVARTLLGYAHVLSRVLPRGLRGIQESKQLTSCRLVVNGTESRGFSINEVVTWR